MMIHVIKRFYKDKVKKIPLADRIQIGFLFLGLLSLFIIICQLNANNKTNRVAVRCNLYSTEFDSSRDECQEGNEKYPSLWSLVPSQVQGATYALTLLSPLTADQATLEAKNASDLYHAMLDIEVFADSGRLEGTSILRNLFYHTQNMFYSNHDAFDCKEEGVLSDGEWRTWKGVIREMHAHPILLTVIWQGYQSRYFSREFARFLQKEICSETVPEEVVDTQDYLRNRDFVKYFYPEMMDKNWPDSLPDYHYTWYSTITAHFF